LEALSSSNAPALSRRVIDRTREGALLMRERGDFVPRPTKLHMPELDGYEFTAACRRDEKKAPRCAP
jgi:CheY-like chemotaxis protein